MRILHFDSDSLGTPYAGGQARRTREINKRLATRHEVTVVTAGFRSLRNETLDGIRYVRALAWPHPANFVWYFAEILPRAIFDRAEIIVEDFSSPFTASVLPRCIRRPVMGVASYFMGKQVARRYHLPIDRWEAFAVAGYRHLIALSNAQEERLHALAPKAEIRVIPNGVDEEARSHPWRGDEAYVAFLGRLDRWTKGLDLLLDASQELPSGLSLSIAGDGPERGWLAKEIALRGLESRVRMVGFLEGARRHEFVARAKALAFPSRYENQSLVGLDALAIGAPIVAFDVPSSRELFEGAAVLTPSFDARAFGRALASVACDQARCLELSARARARAEMFSWDRAALAQERYYRDILEQAGASRPLPAR